MIAKAKTLKYLCISFLFFQINAAALEQNPTTSVKDSTSASLKSKPAFSANINGQITWYKMFADIPSDYRNFFYNSCQVREIPKLVTFSAITGALMFADQAGWKYNNSLVKKYQSLSKLTDLSVKMGDGKYQFLSAALFAIPGLVFRDETAIRTGSNIVEVVISSGLFVQLLKRATGRQSPSASTENGGDWDLFPSIKQYQKNQPAFYSFPSGHLTTTTAIFTVIANNYPDEKWIKPVSYPLLGLLGFSLVGKECIGTVICRLRIFLAILLETLLRLKEIYKIRKMKKLHSGLYHQQIYMVHRSGLCIVFNLHYCYSQK